MSYSARRVTDLRQIHDLGFWVDASLSGHTIATGVSQENDLSGNARHLVQATGADQPTYQTGIVNGLSVLRYDGSNDFMAAAFTLNAPLTRFSVGRFNTSFSAQESMLDGGNANNGRIFRASSNTDISFSSGTISGTVDDNRNFHIYTVITNGNTLPGSISSAFVDAKKIGFGNQGATTGGVTHGAIGGGGGDWASCDIAADAIFSRILTWAEIEMVWDYLHNRFGIVRS